MGGMMWDYVRDIALWVLTTIVLYFIFSLLVGLFAALVGNDWSALQGLVVFWKHAIVPWIIPLRVACWIVGGYCAGTMME